MLRSLALAGALALAGLAGLPQGASAASLPNQEAVGASNAAPLVDVQYGYRRGYGRRGYYGRNYYRPRYYGRRYYGRPYGYGGPRFYGPGAYVGPRGAYFGY